MRKIDKYLQAIFYCPPGLFALSGQRVPSARILPAVLKAGIKPQSSDFKLFLANSSIDLSQVPTCFGSPPSQTPGYLSWHMNLGLDELSNCIQYLFSDGQLITAREILYHENSLVVPQDLLPLLDQIRPGVTDNPWINLMPGEKLPLWSGLRQAELTLLSILMSAQRHPSLELWLTDSQDRESDRPALLLKSIQITTRPDLSWRLTSDGDWAMSQEAGWASLCFSNIPSEGNRQVLNPFELNSADHTLRFHPYKRMIDLVSQSLYPHTQNKEPSVGFKFSLQGHLLIQEVVKEVDLKLKVQGFPPIQKLSSQEIAASEVEPQIWIAPEGEIRFCRRTKTLDGEKDIWNLPQITLSLLKGLNGGLGATSKQENKYLAQDRRGIKRDRDLKVLRHAGFFALILLETTSFALRQQSFEGKPLSTSSEFLGKLFARLGILLYEVERKAGFIDLSPPPPLDKLCSKNVTDLIQEYVFELIALSNGGTDSIYTSSGEIRLRGGTTSVLELFHTILSRAATESRGQCFLKPKWNAFSHFLGEKEDASLASLRVRGSSTESIPWAGAQSYDPVSNGLTPSQVLHAFLPLREKGFSLFYNGLPLNEMNTADFKPVFNLVEQEEPEQKAGKSIDWFELHPKFFFQGVEVDPEKLARLTKEGVLEFQGKIYLIQNKNLPSVKRLEAFWARIQSGKSGESKRKTEDTFLRLPKSQTLEMLALRASGVSVTGGARWKKICHFYDNLETNRTPLDLPPTIRAELKPYQKTGVQWLLDLYDLGLGGILADDMGLGKTIQTLVFLECLRTRKEMGATLVVVPTSLTYNWTSETARFTPDIPTLIFQSKLKTQAEEFLAKNQNALLISTYGLFTEHREFFEKQNWNILVFDEAQNLKNITAKRTTASRMIPAKFKVCLTGTPLENHLGEFYSLLDLAVSGSLGELGAFREKFVTPDNIDPGELRYLKLKAKPLVLRRTKSEILSELPPKIESTIRLPFEQKQEKIYRDIALSWNEKVKGSILDQGESKSQLLMLTALLRLRQACSDPASIPHIKYSEEPPKVTVLMEALQEITESGESALVFTQFLHTFGRIKKELSAQGIEGFSLHGGTSRPERERILRDFQSSTKGSVLLMTLKTGGVGLNLVKASYVFHLEPWWNPAVENQASDRAHRLGQEKAVQVYRYLMRESVEEKIEILKERKSARFNALFSSSESETELSSGGALLSQADFEYLLS